jgi:hypothetical protein
MLKDKTKKLEDRLREALEENEKHVNNLNKQEKEIKTLKEFNDKLKQVLKKVQKKGKIDNGIRHCKNCNKEFNDKENYNWSCRIHQSDWGGEMWWCCGKREKDHPGCKFAKHETKEEDELPDPDAHVRNLKNMRCTACKDMGHTIDVCYKDPNYKTMQDMNIDTERINKIKVEKKMHVDSNINTTHFIKKSVMVPLKEDELGRMHEPKNKNNPFMRGIMEFDDYNYSQVNEFILLEEPAELEKKRIIRERRQLAEQKKKQALQAQN